MVNEKRCRLLPAFLLLLPFLASCTTLRLQVARPEGFAEEQGRLLYRAVSPEGVLYRVRTVENDPPMDLEFWGEALRNHLSAEGYPMIGQGQRFTGEGEGMMYEWGVRYAEADYLYLTAVLVFGDRIAIAEAGGEHTFYRRYRGELIESLKSIRLER